MSNKDILGLCAGNLLRRKTRTILAVIGVIVGVCAIVVMVSIGVGLKVGFQNQLEGFGNLHTIEIYNYGGGGMGGNGQQASLDDATIKKMEKIPGLTAITPVLNTYLTIGIDNMKTETSIQGVDPAFISKMNYDLDEGRLLNGGDTDSNVLLFGRNVACQFYDPRKAYGPDWNNTEPTVNVITGDAIMTQDWNWGTPDQGSGEIQYEIFDCEGVGLLSSMDDETSYKVYMPIKALQKILDANTKAEGGTVSTSKPSYNNALAYVDDIDKVTEVSAAIKEEYGFQTYSLNDMLQELQQTASMIEIVLGGIGAISLLVAAIGIANTMIMSVYERTREISVMKVIGASLKDIQKMFLLEAGMIGFGGGLIGIGLSFGISALMNTTLAGLLGSLIGTGNGPASVIPWWLALGALAFATMVGILSGWAPARRAMNLSVLEGLKNE